MTTSISKQRLDPIKSKLIDGILLYGTILGTMIFVMSFFPLDKDTFNFDFYTDVVTIGSLFLVTTFKKRLSSRTKAVFIIIALSVFVITDVYQYGLYATDKNLIVLIPFLSILIFSPLFTLSVYTFVTAAYLAIGYMISQGMVDTIIPNDEELRFISWVESAGIISIVSFAIALFVHQFNETMYKFFSNLEDQNKKLIERDQLLTNITNNIPRSFVSVIDSDLVTRFAGGLEFENSGLEREMVLDKPVKDFLDMNQKESLIILNLYKNTLKGHAQTELLLLQDNHYLFKTVPLKAQDGSVNSILSVIENVTDQVQKDQILKENLEEKNVMLQEIHHRVKNNLAVVSGLLDLQSFHIEDKKMQHMLQKSTNRILSIAKVHEMLYESQNFNKLPFDEYITELSTVILSSMNEENRDIDFQTDINIKNININHGVPLGIIFNELITNSVKYGFGESAGNVISITVNQVGSDIEVVYYDNGKGINDFERATQKSLGFTLIRSLMDQIQASYKYETTNGFKVTFTFPAILETGPYSLN